MTNGGKHSSFSVVYQKTVLIYGSEPNNYSPKDVWNSTVIILQGRKKLTKFDRKPKIVGKQLKIKLIYDKKGEKLKIKITDNFLCRKITTFSPRQKSITVLASHD